MTVRRAEPAGSLTSERNEAEGSYTGAGGLRLVLAVAPVEVLADPLRVVDDLVAVDQQRHPALPGQLDDLGAAAAPVGDALGPVLDSEAAQLPGHRAARAEVIGRGRAAVEDDRGAFAGAHRGRNRPATRPARPTASRSAPAGPGEVPIRPPSCSLVIVSVASRVSS